MSLCTMIRKIFSLHSHHLEQDQKKAQEKIDDINKQMNGVVKRAKDQQSITTGEFPSINHR